MTLAIVKIFKILLVVVLFPLAGALIRGLDRKLTARMQGRIGPPLLQPVYDIIKLFHKEQLVVNRQQVVFAWLHLAFLALSCIMLVMGQDALMLLFILAFSTLFLVMGGMCVRSPFSRIGSQREILLMLAYEPVLVLMVVCFYRINGAFDIQSVFDRHEPLLPELPLMFAAFLPVLAIKLQKSPFDLATSHHAHQEIVKGITIEFSGPILGIIEIAHCYETAFFLALAGLFWATNALAAAALMAGAFFAAIAVDNLLARLTMRWTFQFMGFFAFALALTNFIWLYWNRGA